MSAKAKYYVEFLSPAFGYWKADDGVATKAEAIAYIGRCYECGDCVSWRIRHRGRIIARWKDGKRMR